MTIVASLADALDEQPGSLVHERDREIHAIVEAARGGDRVAFAQLYDRYFDRLYRYTLVRVRSVPDAEDIVAEAMAAVWKALPGFRWQGAPFSGWMFSILGSRIAMHGRRMARAAASIDAVQEQWLHGRAQADDHSLGVVDRMAVHASLAGLSDDQRQVVELRFYGSLTSEEIAHALGKSPGAVRQLQLRALERLRVEIASHEAAA